MDEKVEDPMLTSGKKKIIREIDLITFLFVRF